MGKTAAENLRIGKRMQSLECFRLIASMMVVFVHCESSGEFGTVMNCLARIAVPFFFVVSGYFLYNVSEKTIRKRFWSAVKLMVFAHLLYLLWDAGMKGIGDLRSFLEWSLDKCSGKTLTEMFLINRSPLRSFLWYLNAVVPCYAVIWLYVRWAEQESCNYRPLYYAGFFLYVLHVVFSALATACEWEISHRLYRNALLFGMPMFCLGIFLHENQTKILRIYGLTKFKLAVLILAGAGLSILQWRGTGKVEMPVGTLLEVIALMLLLVTVPEVSKKSAWIPYVISTFGALSTYVYITHMIWADVYNKYIKEYVLMIGEAKEAFLYPFSVLALTLITGILYLCLRAGLKWTFEHIRLHDQQVR